MILSLTIAWCLLSIPVGVLLGKCMRQGLHGELPAGLLGGDAAASTDDTRRGDGVDVPQQRQPVSAPAQLQDV